MARVLVRLRHLRRLSPLMLLWRVVAAAGRSDCPLGDWRRLALLSLLLLLRLGRSWSLALLRSRCWGLALWLRWRLRLVLDLGLLGLRFILGGMLLLSGRLLGDRCLALGHVPFVFLLLVTLLVLESHLLVFRLYLRGLDRPSGTKHLCNLSHARIWIVDAYTRPVVIGVPHEGVDAPLWRIWVLFGSHSLPLTRVWGHLVLVLLF